MRSVGVILNARRIEIYIIGFKSPTKVMQQSVSNLPPGISFSLKIARTGAIDVKKYCQRVDASLIDIQLLFRITTGC